MIETIDMLREITLLHFRDLDTYFIYQKLISDVKVCFLFQRLESLYQTEPQLIHSWSFANRFPHILKDQKYSKLQSCLEYFLLKVRLTLSVCLLRISI